MWALGVVAEIVLFLFMARDLTRFSVRWCWRPASCWRRCAGCCWATLADHLGVLLFAQLLHAATFGSFHAAAIHFVQRSFGPTSRARVRRCTRHWPAPVAPSAHCTPATAGRVPSAAWTFAIASLVALAAAIIIALRLHEERA